ncbi:hypothetical protein GOD78_11025 [Sinorhizobium medicae]|nr:hypothetical protein [Sinorhizobium medicae]MDX0818050.1 hypothetical protein [Sinorhizobium medicae]
MEAENFLASGFATRQTILSKPSGWFPLSDIARTWQPNRLKGIQVSPEFGTPFLAATQVFDLRPISRKWLSLDRTDDHVQRFVNAGTILLTCSGSVGRATLADDSISGVLISHDLLRIEVQQEEDWGWVYAYLRAPTTRAMMTSARYGHMIKHLEVSHLDPLPIITTTAERKTEFTRLANEIVNSRNRAHKLVDEAEQKYAVAIGSPSVSTIGVTGFTTTASALLGRGRRLEGGYHNPVARAAEEAVTAAGRHIERLGSLVERVFIPGRFKHVYGPDGLPYLDSAQVLEVAPDVEKFVLSLNDEKRAGYLVNAGTLLLPCSGQLHGVIGNVVLAGSWHENKVLTNHILRIVPKAKPNIRTGYLQAVLSHPQLGRPRVLRGAYGSSVPELSVWDIENMTVPRLAQGVEDEIANAMEEAARLAANANTLEDKIAEDAEDVVRDFLSHKPGMTVSSGTLTAV